MEYTVSFPGLGLELHLNRVAIAIGGFNVYWYGVLIALGLVLAMSFAFHYAPDFGVNTDRMIDVVIIGVAMGVICARAYYVAFAPFRYESIWQMLDIRQGGLAIYGGIIGGFIFAALASKWRRVPMLPMLDLAAMGLLIGQGIGRWGNFVNQEAFGANTTLPWGMYSEGTHNYLAGVQSTLAAEGVMVDPSLPVHPTFLYESVWCLAGLLLLWLVFMKRRRFAGQLFLTYLIWYGAGRYWIESLRTDSLMLVGNLRTSQVVALVSVAAAVVVLVWALQKTKGKAMTVPLAVEDYKKQEVLGDAFTPDTLPARAPHAEFVAATKAMNERLNAMAAQLQEQPKKQPETEGTANAAEVTDAEKPSAKAEVPDTEAPEAHPETLDEIADNDPDETQANIDDSEDSKTE